MFEILLKNEQFSERSGKFAGSWDQSGEDEAAEVPMGRKLKALAEQPGEMIEIFTVGELLDGE
ncbi:hypothetical protein [Vibrio parahaemolyticus]|uniref:hypothetical protein n=1 Tax=Vibrio parahaemolyticus TaxID=670 RepID=UPI0004D4B1E7|nr:hypothetical protein [Vibrio parahaemolyticus]EJG0618268.1 hypothetical protein [Vibrio parahaemolyticus]EJG0636490.1 hypothetical protein [Vibrio parahaemolyticus]EJG0686021.1 hypothetical protein [Vibrio parahaemolyticus]EJG0699230.1 hypothetical protein [Vibrio parahaemolyticus]EJG0726540.1 hypothetical protein [Vibrio parahaemolyticus]